MLTNSHNNSTKITKITEQSSLNKLSRPISTKIVSNTPGRLRLRIASSDRHPGEMHRIANVLKSQSYINQVRTNINTGSIIINYDGQADSLEKVLHHLLNLGINFANIHGGKSEAANSLANSFSRFNQQFQQATNGEVDLRILFPLGLSVLAIRQLILKGLQLENIPWYVMAWYAFDSFLKLNTNNQAQPGTDN